MANYRVNHKTHGEGFVKNIKNGMVTVSFPIGDKTFVLKDFNKYFAVYDGALQKLIDDANAIAASTAPQAAPMPTFVGSNSTAVRRPQFSNSLLGPRSQTIAVGSQSQMFELVGYMARPGRISSIEAEVPKDGRDDLFEDMFPGQTYRPIELGDTPSGLPNKLSPQFRINFSNLRNCPQVLKVNVGAGNASCVGRINKSRFVMELVQNYGFRFGDTQDVSEIRRIAEARGHLADFERGYSI